MKNLISSVLTLIVCLVVCSFLSPTALAETIASGTSGDNLNWTLDNEGTLFISGYGDMTSSDGWSEHIDEQGAAEAAQETAEQAKDDAEVAAESVSQSAAQIETNKQEIGELKSALSANTSIRDSLTKTAMDTQLAVGVSGNFTPLWESGRMDQDTGAEIADSNFLRMVDYIDLTKVANIKVLTSVNTLVVFFDSNYNYAGRSYVTLNTLTTYTSSRGNYARIQILSTNTNVISLYVTQASFDEMKSAVTYLAGLSIDSASTQYLTRTIPEIYTDAFASDDIEYVYLAKGIYSPYFEKYICQAYLRLKNGDTCYIAETLKSDTQDGAYALCAGVKEVYPATNYRCYAIVDWDYVNNGSQTINMDSSPYFIDVNDITKATRISAYITENLQKESDVHNALIPTEYDEVAQDTADGINKYFTFANPIKGNTALCVYKNGLKQFLNHDYTMYYKNRWVKFNTAPQAGDTVGFHYNTLWKKDVTSSDLADVVTAEGDAIKGDLAQDLFLQFNNFGKGTAQWAETVTDPTDNTKTVLSFNAVSTTKTTRVQAHSKNMDANYLDETVDIYFPSASLECLKNYPDEIWWLTIQEFWCPYGSSQTNPGYRATLGIGKKAGTGNLYFNLRCENQIFIDDQDTYVGLELLDDRETQNYPVPFDKWITIHSTVKSGSSTNGHYTLDVTVDGVTTTIFDATIPVMPTVLIDSAFNHSPESVISNSTALLKMYTSKTLLDYVVANSQMGQMQILFKNLSYTQYNIDRDAW